MGGERHRGGGLGERAIHGRVTKGTRPNTSEGVFIPAETGQTGSMDRSDRSVRPVRSVPGIGQTGWSAASPCTRSHLTADVRSSELSLLHDAAILMKIWSAIFKGPRNPGRWPVLRKPPKLHAREDSRLHAVAF